MPGNPDYGFDNLWPVLMLEHNRYKDRPPVPGAPDRELVPEPHHEVDPTAVAVYDRGRRFGYLPAEKSAEIHDMVRAANLRGRAVTLQRGRADYAVLVPYFDYKIPFYKESGLKEEIEQFIDAVVDKETDILWRRGYKITDEDVQILRRHSNMVPSLTWPEVHPYYRQTWYLYGTMLTPLYMPGALRWEIKLRRDKLENLRLQAEARNRENRNAAAIEMYVGGVSVEELAIRLGISSSTVYQIFKEAEAAGRPSPRLARRQERDDRVVRHHRDGQTQSAIAERLGVSQATVAKILQENGIETSFVSNEEASLRRAERAMTAAKMQKSGSSRAEIADHFGTSIESIKVLLRDGRFYLDPEAYPERWAETRGAHADSPSRSKAEKRLRRDLGVLKSISPELLQ